MTAAQKRMAVMLAAAAVTSLVIPGCLLLVRVAQTQTSVAQELASMTSAYGYVWLSTTVLALAGTWWLGRNLARARRVAVTDPLTGLFNRRYFAASLTSETARDRGRGLTTCVLCLDLDGFKNINDRFGHGQGDAALVAVARILTQGLRIRDVVARFGGDEFAILLPGTGARAAVTIGERILLDLTHETSMFVGGLSVSIGVAEVERTGTSTDVLAAADRALYWAKRAGGGRVALAPPAAEAPTLQ